MLPLTVSESPLSFTGQEKQPTKQRLARLSASFNDCRYQMTWQTLNIALQQRQINAFVRRSIERKDDVMWYHVPKDARGYSKLWGLYPVIQLLVLHIAVHQCNLIMDRAGFCTEACFFSAFLAVLCWYHWPLAQESCSLTWQHSLRTEIPYMRFRNTTRGAAHSQPRDEMWLIWAAQSEMSCNVSS